MKNNPQLNLKYYREIKGISQKNLSEKLGISQGYISEIEKGLKSPTVRMLYKFAESLEICPHVLLPVTIYCTKENKCIIGGNDKWKRTPIIGALL